MSPPAAQRRIEAIMAERLGRECLLVPSGRLALLLAFASLLAPGDRILMSPVNDDVILFTVLAAGLRPVMAPLSPDDGNIDVGAVEESVWPTLAAVLTTNLYGLPDRMEQLRARCERHRILLIEDGAHALETTVEGTAIGGFGDVAAFSLSKHVAARAGGVLAPRQERLLPELARLRDAATIARPRCQRVGDLTGSGLRQALSALHLTLAARRLRRMVMTSERVNDRMPLRPAALREAVVATGQSMRPAGGADRICARLDAFEPWLRVDRHDYRAQLLDRHHERILRRLDNLEAERVRRVEGVRRLAELEVVAPAVRRGPAQPLFRVPLLVEDRDTVRAALERRGIPTHYIYNPPLDDYAGPSFVERSPAPEAARWWARHVLPVDPLHAEDAIEALEDPALGLRPAVPLTASA